MDALIPVCKSITIYNNLLQSIYDASAGQVDVREYLVPGGHRPMDKSLILRIVRMMQELILFKSKHESRMKNANARANVKSNITQSDKNSDEESVYKNCNEKNEKGTNGKIRVDVVASTSLSSPSSSLFAWNHSSDSDASLMHILGPPMNKMLEVCKSNVLYRFRHEVLKSPSEDLHCAPCSPFNAR